MRNLHSFAANDVTSKTKTSSNDENVDCNSLSKEVKPECPHPKSDRVKAFSNKPTATYMTRSRATALAELQNKWSQP